MIIDIVLDRVSIHALLAECDDLADINTFLERVSIHALLAECDVLHPPLLSDARSFNPRTPCGVRRQPPDNKETIESFNPRTPCGVRLFETPLRLSIAGFQSTHSLRSATSHQRNARPMRPVSIHALLAECDGDDPRNTN